MLTITNTHTNKEATTFEDGTVETNYFTTYETKGAVKLAMDSIWKYEGKDTVNVNSVQVIKTESEDEEFISQIKENINNNFESSLLKILEKEIINTIEYQIFSQNINNIF